jgi:hypothetical protein
MTKPPLSERFTIVKIPNPEPTSFLKLHVVVLDADMPEVIEKLLEIAERGKRFWLRSDGPERVRHFKGGFRD